MVSTDPIIITGGAQRLGLAAAKHLCTQGHQVVITYRTPRAEIHQFEQKGIVCMQADFATQIGIQSFIDDIQQRYTAIRAIIHNASDWCAESKEQAHHVTMEKMMQVHVQAPYQINLALCDNLKHHDGVSDIIHMTDYIQDKGSKKHIAYAASKAALHNMTLSFAAKFAPDIKVNSIAPALLMFNQGDGAAYRQKAMKKSLMQIAPGEQEGVQAIEFILASRYMTGRSVHLDGGRHLK